MHRISIQVPQRLIDNLGENAETTIFHLTYPCEKEVAQSVKADPPEVVVSWWTYHGFGHSRVLIDVEIVSDEPDLHKHVKEELIKKLNSSPLHETLSGYPFLVTVRKTNPEMTSSETSTFG